MTAKSRTVRRAVAPATPGTVIKFFDFFLYGLLAAFPVGEVQEAACAPIEVRGL